MFPALVGQDAFTGASNGSGLAEKWSFSADGRTITFTLHPDLQWSDGQPITAQDLFFTYTLIRDVTVASPYHQNFTNIEAIDVMDDRTFALRLGTPDCTIFQTLRQPILPAHLYQHDPAQFLAADPNRPPTVGAGPFLFAERNRERIVLVRNPRYRLGAPLLEQVELRIIADLPQQLAGLGDGTVDLVHLSTEALAGVQPAPGVVIHTAPLDSITFVALNLANPARPQPGRAADGSLVPQEPHPILGTLPVRQALAAGLDYAALMERGFANQALRAAGYLLPSITWAYNTALTPYAYDPANAMELLANAGWIDQDGDGVRERNGELLRLRLLTNDDSTARVRLGELLQQQWQAIGVDLQFEAVPFETLTRALLAQRYDLVLIGWEPLGAEPANSDFWLSRQDLPTEVATAGDAGGANFVSYQNVAVDQWLDEARTVPDCDGGYRALRYRRVQERIHADIPYIILGVPLQGWAYRQEWQDILPQPWQFDQNIQRWWRAE
jgi:peptide/nickel transport system substrate-binding protein